MEPPKSKEELLDMISSERETFDKLLSTIPQSKLSMSGVEAEWSIKDILAHIVFWETLMVRWLEEAQNSVEPQILPPGKTWDDLDEINQDAFLENRDRDLEEVLASYQDHYPQVFRSGEDAPVDVLMDADKYAWREGTPIWEMVAANTCWHYKEHHEAISKWIEGR